MGSMSGPRALRASPWLFVLLVGNAALGCRSPGLVGQLCVGENCPPPSECRDGSCERQPECTLQRCEAGLCSDADCTALRCAAGIAGPACPAPCPGGVCTPICTDASCPVASCNGGPCGPAPCTGVDCPAVEGCDGGACVPQSPGADAGCDGGTCEPMAMSDCDADAGSCDDAPSCETGPCIGAACDDCEPDPGCNATHPVCPSCRNDGDCAQGETQRCDTAAGRCVECLNASQCGGYEPFCIDGDCEECRDDDDCIGRGLGRCRSGDCGF
jgi:hypothetical protein